MTDPIHYAARIDLAPLVYRALCGHESDNPAQFINWKNVNAATKNASGEWRITCAECISRIGEKQNVR